MIQVLRVPEGITCLYCSCSRVPAIPDLLLSVPPTTTECLFLLYIHILRKGKGLVYPWPNILLPWSSVCEQYWSWRTSVMEDIGHGECWSWRTLVMEDIDHEG